MGSLGLGVEGFGRSRNLGVMGFQAFRVRRCCGLVFGDSMHVALRGLGP